MGSWKHESLILIMRVYSRDRTPRWLQDDVSWGENHEEKVNEIGITMRPLPGVPLKLTPYLPPAFEAG